MLLPLPEASFLRFDLLGEPPAKLLLFLLELGVVELLHLALAILAGLHLLLAVVFVVTLLSRRNEVKHECADEQGTQLAEVAMVLVLHCTSRSTPEAEKGSFRQATFCDTPEVLAALHDAAIGSLDIFRGAND